MATKSIEQLNDFINRARSSGKADADIKNMLLNAGWDESLVRSALLPTGELVPPPPPAPKSSGREIFFYLLQFFTLGTAAVSMGAVVFALINEKFSDEVSMIYYPSTSSVTGALSSFVVALPIFIAVTWKLVADSKAIRVSVNSGIRRVLTYLALFIASATIIGDIISLVYRFLAGEVDSKFILKVVTILLIGGWVIFYFYITVKRDEKGENYPANWHKIHGLAVVIVSLIVAISGFMLSGTPQERQRLVRDQERLMELQNIYYQVQTYYDKENKLPENLAALAGGYVSQEPLDPLANVPYSYIVGEGLNYQLCATFETDDKAANQDKTRPYYEPMSDVNWSHPVGNYCFDLKVIPRLTN